MPLDPLLTSLLAFSSFSVDSCKNDHTFTLMTAGAFSGNVGKAELNLVIDNLHNHANCFIQEHSLVCTQNSPAALLTNAGKEAACRELERA